MHDRSVLTVLMNERDAIKKSLANILKAIEQGILNATTKSRMDELEAQLSEVEDKIVVEQYKAQNQLKKEEVVEYLTHTIKQQPKLLIKNLIQKIVLYDDRFEIYYNYLNHMPPAEDDPDKTIRELSLSGCSDTSPLCPPSQKPSESFGRLFSYRRLTMAGRAKRSFFPYVFPSPTGQHLKNKEKNMRRFYKRRAKKFICQPMMPSFTCTPKKSASSFSCASVIVFLRGK